MMRVDVAVGDVIEIDDGRVTVSVEEKSGRKARLAVDVPASMKIRVRRSRGSAASFARKGLDPLG
jgi:hypothetical protein